MKKIIIALMLLVSAGRSAAQQDSNYVELGINSLRMVSLLIDDEPTDFDVWNPYMFTFDAHIKFIGLRFGFGQDKREMSELPTVANGKVYTRNDTTRTDLRFGLYYEKNLHQRWSMRLGADYFTARTVQNLSTEFLNENNVTVKTLREISTKEKGVEPFLFFQYHLAPRISLGTELMWRISVAKTDDIDSNSLNELTYERTFEEKKRIIMAPTSLFLIARF
ncbi:MAG: hypothetical protein ACKVOR_08520 [Flavobacteriales bacterium]